jgi:hypothetical protein
MPPAIDDPTIGPERFVLRVLLDRWTTTKGGRLRPTSDSFLDSNHENSCFVENEISVDELRRLLGQRQIARIPVSVIRAAGFWLERRPDEAPEGCSNPASHLVCGPPVAPIRKDYERMAKSIVKAPEIEIL